MEPVSSMFWTPVSKTLAFMEPFSSIAKRFPSPLSILSLWNQFPACFGPQFHYTSKTLAFMEPFSSIAKRFPSPLSILSLWNQFPACFGPQFHYTSKTLLWNHSHSEQFAQYNINTGIKRSYFIVRHWNYSYHYSYHYCSVHNPY